MATNEMAICARYLWLPVQNGAPVRHARLCVAGELARAFEIELAQGAPDFWVSADLDAFRGQELSIEVDGLDPNDPALAAIRQDDVPPGEADQYGELLRPQFHFSSRRGWLNDPNGLTYYRGEYHLFYQHNPYGWSWGNMHWGHAVSPDLVHWRELGDALYPDRLGTCFSGSGVVDARDTAGLRRGDEHPLLCIYTSAGGTSAESAGQPFTQSIAYSNDRGRTWQHYRGNPVVPHIAARNRDPKVIWHEPTRTWVMALYLEDSDYTLLASPDLVHWTRLCDVVLPGASECPDFFPLPVDGNPEDVRWVFWGANGTYLVGRFDGARFEAMGSPQRYDWGGDTYAAQTWSDIPAADGRRIQMAWLRVPLPGMPFNQCMGFPCALELRTTTAGVRLFAEPVREIASLYARSHRWERRVLPAGHTALPGSGAELWDIGLEFEVGRAESCGVTVRGEAVTYDLARQQLTCAGRSAPLAPVDGRIRLRILVDRASIEVYGNDGAVALPLGVLLADRERSLTAFSRGGATTLYALEVHELRSAWAESGAT
ncbi:MAG: GH32 C-terminal domain-containing protein [Anaerolineae bacterium]|nr:GH32 C-terminal domain-containing protein [Anaerolineae bacterium]